MGKWIGGFLGLLSGGPLGALAGFVFGALIDMFVPINMEVHRSPEEEARYQQQGNRNGFLFSLMVLTAHIVHADGRIMHSEMEFVRRFLRTNFNADAEREGEAILLKLFQQKKQMGAMQWDNQIQAVCGQISTAMPHEHRLQLIAFLCEIAKADGTIAPEEREALRQVCAYMNLEPGTADQMLGLGGSSLNEAYQLFGITPDATDDEVRRAYKKMAMQHHPDRVAHLGEDVRKASEKKFQEINEAKERIYKARGMK